MNNQDDRKEEKRDKRRWLAPLIALAVGVGLPLYAYADGPGCTACHNDCEAIRVSETQGCASTWPYGSPAYNNCVAVANAHAGSCHSACQSGICSQ